MSSDGKVLVFHDHDLRRLCASALTVEATTADVLTRQKLSDTGEHIPLLIDLLGLVKGRVPILIELKCRRNATQLARAVAADLDGYVGPVGLMSFEPAVGKWLSRHTPAQRRGLVISRNASAFGRWRSIRASAAQFLAIDRSAIECPWVERERKARWIYSWTIRSPVDRETAEVHADALIWEGDGRPGN